VQQVADGKCPHCSSTVDVDPIEIDQEVNRVDCGGLIGVGGLAQNGSEAPSVGLAEQERVAETPAGEAELFLSLTVVCVFVNMIRSMVWGIGANVFFVLITTMILLAMSAHAKTKDVFPPFVGKRLDNFMERLSIFPYEIFLIPGWIGLIALWGLRMEAYREVFGVLLLIFAIVLSLMARKALRDPLVIREQNRFLSIGDFIKSLFNSAYRAELRTKNSERLHQAELHFDRVAAEQKKLAEQKSERVTETAHELKKNEMEREKWQADADDRYKKWMADEKKRFSGK